MKRPTNIQQPISIAPNESSNKSSVKYIRRTDSQAMAAQTNMHQYFRPPVQSLNKIQEAQLRKPLSRKSSLISPRFKTVGKQSHRTEGIEFRQPQKKFVATTLEDIAMHLAAHIFMASTTKFVPGYEDLSSMEAEAKSSIRKASPLKNRLNQSISSKKRDEKSVPDGKRAEKSLPAKVFQDRTLPANKPTATTPKKAVTPGKDNIVSPNPSISSILNSRTPRISEGGNAFNQKSKLQQSFQEIASQNASRLSRPQVRIREIQPNEVVHPSGIRTKNLQQPSYSSVKSNTPKNPEDSFIRISGQNIKHQGSSFAEAGPIKNDARYTVKSKDDKERSVSQPYKPQKQPLSPQKPQQRLRNRGDESPSKISIAEASPVKQFAGTTPIKSTIALESRTDLPKPDAKPIIQNTQIRNRFQTDLLKQQTVPTSIPARQSVKTPDVKAISKQKEEPKRESAARYGKPPEKSTEVSTQFAPIARKYAPAPQRDTSSQLRSVSQKVVPAEQKKVVPSKQVEREQKQIEHIAYKMTSEHYLTATTKYVKAVGISSNGSVLSFAKQNSLPKQQQQANSRSRPKENQRSSPKQQTTSQTNLRSVSQTKIQANNQAPIQNVWQARQQQKAQLAKTQPIGNKLQAQVAKKEEQSRSINDNRNSKSPEKNAIKKQVSINESKQEQKSEPFVRAKSKTDNYMRGIKIEEQRERNLSVQKAQAIKNEQRQKQQSMTPKAPFVRQPAGSRSPLLFSNKTIGENVPTNQAPTEAVKTATSPVGLNQNKIKNAVSPAQQAKINQTEKSIRDSKQLNNASSTSNILVSPRNAANVHPQGILQRNNQQKIIPTKEPEPQLEKKQPAKQLQSRPTVDTSIQSNKNTTNTLVGSKSSDTFQRVWRPTQPTRIDNKVEISNTLKAEDSSKKIEPRGYHRPTEQKPVQSSEQSIKIQPRNANKNVKKDLEPTSLKSLPSQDISGKKSPVTKHSGLREQQLPVNNEQTTNKNTKIVTKSPQTSVIQNNVSISTTNQQQYHPNSRQVKILSSATSPQAISAKTITTVQSPGRDVQIKSESNIKIGYGKEVKPVLNQNQIVVDKQFNLQRSLAIVYAMSKLKVNIKRSIFNRLKSNRCHQSKHMKQATILAHSVKSLFQTLFKSNLKTGFGQLKKILIGKYQGEKPIVIKPNQVKNTVGRVVAHFLLGKLRQRFTELKKNCWFLKQLGISNINSKKSQKNGEDNSKIQLKNKLLSSVLTINKNYQSTLLKVAIDKILLFSIGRSAKKIVVQLSNSSVSKNHVIQAKSPQKYGSNRDYEGEKKSLLQVKQDIENQIARKQYSIGDKKRVLEREKTKLIKKLQELRKNNAKSEGEVATKRQKNSELKKLIDNYSNSNEPCLPEGEPLLGLLTQIYSEVFKNAQEAIDISSLVQKYSLNKEDFHPIIEQWNTLFLNLSLKRELAIWEGAGAKQGKMRQSLNSEKQLEVSLMRNYLKERYLWEWVHTASTKL